MVNRKLSFVNYILKFPNTYSLTIYDTNSKTFQDYLVQRSMMFRSVFTRHRGWSQKSHIPTFLEGSAPGRLTKKIVQTILHLNLLKKFFQVSPLPTNP